MRNQTARSKILAALAVGLCALMVPGLAQAQSCRALQAELASVMRGGGDSAEFQRFSNAVQRQARELDVAERRYRALRCGVAATGQCRVIGNTIGQMRANLDRLTNLRDSHAGGGSQREITRLRARVAQACDTERGQQRSASVIRREPGTRAVARPQILRPNNVPTGPAITGAASYRTMCVRTCDGYFFPISFAAGPSTFARDEAVCAALCPASPTKLFAYPTGQDDGPMTMIALDGTPYTDLQTAFDFRDGPRKPDCTCGRADPNAIGVAGVIDPADQIEQPAPDVAIAVPVPKPRPDRFADPESAMNTNHGLTTGRIASIAGSISVGEVVDMPDGQRDVRVVGGQFLPDPEEAIDLQAPVPRGGR